jgi:pimeloyl-ACP methyl ester carboxylesterase
MIYYEKTGKGPAVVLLHGFPSDHHLWDELVPELKKKCTLLLPDFPGAGGSEALAEPLTLELMARSVEAVLVNENIEQAIICGHSMGGYTALVFARLFPEKTKALSLIHSSAYADSEERKTNRRKAIALIGKGELEKEIFLKSMAPNLFAERFRNAHPEIIRMIIEKGKSLSGATLISFYRAMLEREDASEVLKNATFPVQWIIGDEDTSTPMKDALEQAHLAAVNSISIYRDCGHMSMLERPAALIKDLDAFFTFVN